MLTPIVAHLSKRAARLVGQGSCVSEESVQRDRSAGIAVTHSGQTGAWLPTRSVKGDTVICTGRSWRSVRRQRAACGRDPCPWHPRKQSDRPDEAIQSKLFRNTNCIHTRAHELETIVEARRGAPVGSGGSTPPGNPLHLACASRSTTLTPSTPRSSNRVCGYPALGFRLRSCSRSYEAACPAFSSVLHSTIVRGARFTLGWRDAYSEEHEQSSD